jgi:hypothetical protein
VESGLAVQRDAGAGGDGRTRGGGGGGLSRDAGVERGGAGRSAPALQRLYIYFAKYHRRVGL